MKESKNLGTEMFLAGKMYNVYKEVGPWRMEEEKNYGRKSQVGEPGKDD